MYNIAGQKVIEETIKFAEKGEQFIDIDERLTAHLSSGVYFFKILYDNNTVTKKMILLK